MSQTTFKLKRPALRYHGGKWMLGKWIISHFPKHRIYTEVFGGAGSVLLQKESCYSEVYNDIWDTVVNVFTVLRDQTMAAELRRRIELTPFSRSEFDKCSEIRIREEKCPIEKARLTIFRSFAGFGSASTNAEHSTGFRSNGNRSGTTPAHDWANYPNHIDLFTARLRGVIIENRHYSKVLLQHDSPETLHYLDPPYVHSTRNLKRGNAMYAYEMTDDEHIAMFELVSKLKGMVIISGYDSDLYSDLYSGWYKSSRKTFADGANPRVEALWMNESCFKKQSKLTLF